jgi:hypothetical protein
MLYKLFVFVRAPVSIICFLCLGLGLEVLLAGTGVDWLGFVVGLGALAFLGVTTGKQAHCRPDALRFAGVLLALELLSVALFLFTMELTDADFNFLAVGLVGALWTLPNALLFYRWRAKFVGQEKKKPGL